MTKEEYIKFVKDSYKEIFKDQYNEKRAMDSAEAILVESNNDVDKAKAAADVIIARTKAKMDASQKNFDDLSAIKDMLFDAPSEVKEAFNTIVGYFDTEYFAGKGKSKQVTDQPAKTNSVDHDKRALSLLKRYKNKGLKNLLKFIDDFNKNNSNITLRISGYEDLGNYDDHVAIYYKLEGSLKEGINPSIRLVGNFHESDGFWNMQNKLQKSLEDRGFKF